MPQFPVVGPFGETDLADQSGLDPVAELHFPWRDILLPAALLSLRQVDERAGLATQSAHPRRERLQRSAGEAGPNLAGEMQILALEVADEQRAKMLPCALRRSEAADHELLLGDTFQFDPRAAAASDFVNRVALLADD